MKGGRGEKKEDDNSLYLVALRVPHFPISLLLTKRKTPCIQHCTAEDRVGLWLKMGQMIYGVGGGAENKLVASFLGDKMRNKGTFKNVVETNRTRAHSIFFRRAASL